LRPYLLEETYEVLHALDEGSTEALCEELGDLALQIVFHAEVAAESGTFDIGDVLRGINDKLVRRHPHVFADKEARTPDEVVERWERIKTLEENKASSLAGIPRELPALLRAVRILSKISQNGVDLFESSDPTSETDRWLAELASLPSRADTIAAQRALGMLMLAVVGLARESRHNPEDALRTILQRLTDAFRELEAPLLARGRAMSDLPADERRRIGETLLRECEGK
jgi:MazG family protein